MSEADVIVHWRKGARDALEAAVLLHRAGKHPLALFHAHLAVEKALKATYMEQENTAAPFSHDLVAIADRLRRTWTEQERRLLGDLTQYAIAARYDDPAWAEREATDEKTDDWLQRTEIFLSSLLP